MSKRDVPKYSFQNLITGTRRMNTVMKRFEDGIRSYIVGSGNHVMYRVSPDFSEDDLIAGGVRLEALSVEDGGAGISYDVYILNAQDGIVIDYATGESHLENAQETSPTVNESESAYILNTNTMRFHKPDCKNAQTIKKSNRQDATAKRFALIAQGYEPCGACNP